MLKIIIITFFLFYSSYGWSCWNSTKSDKQNFNECSMQAKQGKAIAQFNLGLMYGRGDGVPQDKKQAFYWYKKSAEQGYASAQLSVGIMYARGDGVLQDDKQAAYWFDLLK